MQIRATIGNFKIFILLFATFWWFFLIVQRLKFKRQKTLKLQIVFSFKYLLLNKQRRTSFQFFLSTVVNGLNINSLKQCLSMKKWCNKILFRKYTFLQWERGVYAALGYIIPLFFIHTQDFNQYKESKISNNRRCYEILIFKQKFMNM